MFQCNQGWNQQGSEWWQWQRITSQQVWSHQHAGWHYIYLGRNVNIVMCKNITVVSSFFFSETALKSMPSWNSECTWGLNSAFALGFWNMRREMQTCRKKCVFAPENAYNPQIRKTADFFYEINVLVYSQNMKIELDNDRINMWSLFIRINFRLFLFSPKRSHSLWYRCYREANQGPFISVNMRLFMVRRSNVNHPVLGSKFAFTKNHAHWNDTRTYKLKRTWLPRAPKSVR